jgi:outer membrane immunogenic protein
MKTYALLSAGLMFAGSAYAADMPAPPPAPPPTPNWDGIYVGVNGGGVWGDTKTTLSVLDNNLFAFGVVNSNELGAASDTKFNNSGGMFGGHIGFMTHTTLIPPLTPRGALILGGFELGYDAMSLKGSVLRTFNSVASPGLSVNFNESVKSDWMFTATERGGILLGDWFPYLAAGFAVANFKYNNTYTDNVPLTTTGSLSGVALGAGIGGGLEWRLSSAWSVRGQYMYYEFAAGAEGNATLVNPTVNTAAIFHHQATFREGIAQGAINLKLGNVFDITKIIP